MSLEPSGEVAALIGQRFDAAIEGRLDLPRDEIALSTLSLKGEQLSADGDFTLNLSSGDGHGDLRLKVDSLDPLSPLIGMALGGQADLNTALALKDFGSDVTLDLSGELAQVTIEQPIAAVMLAGDQEITARVSVRPERLAVSELDVEGSQRQSDRRSGPER